MFIVNVEKFAYNKVANLIPFNNAGVIRSKRKQQLTVFHRALQKTNKVLIAIYITG